MPKTDADAFADIGLRAFGAAAGQLELLHPPRLPEKFLPAEQSDPTAAFKPVPKLDSARKLDAELARQRRAHGRYLKDLAPKLTPTRTALALQEFQWRMETPADRADFDHPVKGEGQWTKVTVPHFGGPIGRAAAYYRTAFKVTAAMRAKGAVWIRFGAVDYQAQVFVNGHYLGSHEGFFAPFEFECGDFLRAGSNTLLVRVENDAIFGGNGTWGQPEEGDKLYAATHLGWDDPGLGWSHCPPGMGIYQDVVVEARAAQHLADLWVRPLSAGKAEAHIEVWSCGRTPVPVSLRLSVFGQNFRATVIRDRSYTPSTRIQPGLGDFQKPTDNQDVTLELGPRLNRFHVTFEIPDARAWEPETPWLYQLQVRLLDASGKVLDASRRQFGMRTFFQDTQSSPKGRFYLNGREIKLRGANTMGFEQQDVFKKDFKQLVDDILLAKICRLNFLRLTQRPVQPEVYEYCDRLGLMTQTDLPLFGCLRYTKFSEAIRQAEEMERIVRAHPCNVLISYINEPFPNASGKPHRHLTRPELLAFFEAADRAVRILNPDRVIKHVDGDYDPPSATLPDNHCYSGWYNGHGLELGRLHAGDWIPIKPGWSYGCGEFGSEGLDPADLMRRRYPREWLGEDAGNGWSPDRIHGGQTGNFHAMWFDGQSTMEDWVRASQLHQAWVTRLFTERFRRDNRMVSFAIHLFIDAFPAGWLKSIMDCERKPKLAYFAYRDALEPMAPSIRVDRWKYFSGEAMRFEFWVCNDTHDAPKNLPLRWQIESQNRVVFSQQSAVVIEPMRATFQGFFAPVAPRVDRRTKYTLRLSLGHADTAVEYEVFPKLPKSRRPANVIVIREFNEYRKARRSIDKAVRGGGRAVFLNLDPGDYEIGGSRVRVEACVMRPREFVSRATGHPLVEGFEPEDFKCWFDPRNGCFMPLVEAVFEADNWIPILTSVNSVPGRGWQPRLATAELRSGKGAYLVSQILWQGRERHNPVAALYAHRLLGTADQNL